jgi:hypothetical protein
VMRPRGAPVCCRDGRSWAVGESWSWLGGKAGEPRRSVPRDPVLLRRQAPALSRPRRPSRLRRQAQTRDPLSTVNPSAGLDRPP